MDEIGFLQASSEFPALSSCYRYFTSRNPVSYFQKSYFQKSQSKSYSKTLLLVILFNYFITASFDFCMFLKFMQRN